MDTAVSGGDFVCDAQGRFVEVSGYDEILQRVLIRLCVKRGSFVYDEDLGSRLYTLKASDGNISEKALAIAREALIDVSEVSVDGVTSRLSAGGEHLELDFTLSINDVEKDVVITV